MNWDEWRGSLDGRPTMWIKRIAHFLRCRVDLHKFVAVDDAECFHTHPSWAFRFILWGGYEEQVWTGIPVLTFFRIWRPLHFGVVRPEYCHRVSGILNGRASYSVWLRGPACADVKLIGEGWKKQKATAEGLGDPYNKVAA